MKIYNLKEIIGKLFGYNREPSKIKEINPERDWGIVLVLFIFTSLFIIIFGFYVYGKVNSGSFFESSTVEDSFIETLDRDELKNTIKRYETKSNLFQEIKGQKPELIDPAI